MTDGTASKTPVTGPR